MEIFTSVAGWAFVASLVLNALESLYWAHQGREAHAVVLLLPLALVALYVVFCAFWER